MTMLLGCVLAACHGAHSQFCCMYGTSSDALPSCVVSTVCGLKRRPAEAGRWGGGLCGGGRSAHPDTPSRRYCAVASPVQCSLRVVGGRPREGRGADGVGRARHGILPDDISSSQTGPAGLHVVSPYGCRCAGLSTCNLPAPTRSRNEDCQRHRQPMLHTYCQACQASHRTGSNRRWPRTRMRQSERPPPRLVDPRDGQRKKGKKATC